MKSAQLRPIALLEPDLPPLEDLAPYFSRVKDSGHFSNFGPMVVSLESRMADIFFRDSPMPVHCVTTSSGTTGIEIALQAMRLLAGARILIPAFGFPAAALAAIRLGYEPVFTEVDETSWQMAPDHAERIVAEGDISAVIPVTSLGYAEDAEAWGQFSDSHDLPVLIDAAAALGNQTVHPGTVVASSMHATKALGIGEGGLIATTDYDLAGRMRALTNFGFENRIVTHIGGNAKLSEWHAAIAHAQLDRWDAIGSRRRKVRERYREHLEGIPLRLHPDTWSAPVPAFMPVRMPSGIAAEKLVEALDAESIGARRWFWPALPDHPALTGRRTQDALDATRDLAASLVCLPFHSRLQDEDIQRVANIVRQVVDAA